MYWLHEKCINFEQISRALHLIGLELLIKNVLVEYLLLDDD